MQSIFFEITVVIFLAAVLSIVFRFLKQPSILAFIITGVIVGPLGPFQFQNHGLMESLASIGITLLLFMIGLELRLSELKSVGRTVAIAGSFQLFFTSLAGFGVSRLIGFSNLASAYIGVALAFSSTIVVIKLLSDKKVLKSLYGKITIGILLVQDLVAIFILIALSTLSGTSVNINFFDLLVVLLKMIVLFGWVIVLSREVLPRLLNVIARSPESLLLFSLAWAFGISALVSSPFIGFSIEIGGLLAGIALASSIESYQIITKVRSLRDFFLTIFFVTLGTRIAFSNLSEIIIPAVIFSLFVLVLGPVIVMIILGALGYKKRTSFFTGVALAQISEFSLIMIFLGQKIGHLSSSVVSIITSVGVITFVFSTYFITQGNSLYRLFMPYLGIFERGKTNDEKKQEEVRDHTILIGANRMGEGILEALLKKRKRVLVVDFDPDIIEKLNKQKVETFFGDITDPEIQELVSLDKANLIISTIADPQDTLHLLKRLKSVKGPKVIAAAYEKEDARDFYNEGADYVILPHIAGGHHLAKLLSDERHLELIEEYKKKELVDLS